MPCFFTGTGVGTGDSGTAGTCGLRVSLPLLSRMASADDLVGRARKGALGVDGFCILWPYRVRAVGWRESGNCLLLSGVGGYYFGSAPPSCLDLSSSRTCWNYSWFSQLHIGSQSSPCVLALQSEAEMRSATASLPSIRLRRGYSFRRGPVWAPNSGREINVRRMFEISVRRMFDLFGRASQARWNAQHQVLAKAIWTKPFSAVLEVPFALGLAVLGLTRGP